MRIDASKSKYQEDEETRSTFTPFELRRLRVLLRRLRFLEANLSENAGKPGSINGAMHAEMEMEALEWALNDIGFLNTLDLPERR